MDNKKLIAALQRIKAITDEALGQAEHEKGDIKKSGRVVESRINATTPPIAFDMNVLAFMNKYGRGLKGPHKFTLLLARLSKGSTSQLVPRATLESHWNKMKVVLGGKFNPAHANRAKAKGWVDSPKHGSYTLSDSWKECLAGK